MKRILTALALIPIVLVLVFLGPKWQWLFAIGVATAGALAGWEYLGLARKVGAHPPGLAVVSSLVALFAASFFWPYLRPEIFGALCLALLTVCAFRGKIEQMMADASA